jgi:ABC-2 type transport system ATP-binding protein
MTAQHTASRSASISRPGVPGLTIAAKQATSHGLARVAQDPMLEVNDLVKRFGSNAALDRVSLRLSAGQFTALLGPNGAGKTTLFQVLTGLYSADQGEVFVAGRSLRRHTAAALRHIGVVFQQPALDLDLTVLRNLRLQCDLHGLTGAQAAERIASGCAAMGLGDDLHRKTRELSGGTRRKVELVRALLHRPAVLLMDEATVGLDPKSRRDLLAAIRRDVRERGTCVLWATHWVEEAEQADRVVVLHKGRLLADGTPSDVAQELGGPSLEEAFVAATAGGQKPTE